MLLNRPQRSVLTAVKQCGWTIKYVEEQTPELCMIAVQQFGWTIDYIENQTPELCAAALKQDVKAAKYIRLPTNKTQQIEFLDKLYNLLKEEGLSTSVLRTIKESQK